MPRKTAQRPGGGPAEGDEAPAHGGDGSSRCSEQIGNAIEGIFIFQTTNYRHSQGAVPPKYYTDGTAGGIHETNTVPGVRSPADTDLREKWSGNETPPGVPLRPFL